LIQEDFLKFSLNRFLSHVRKHRMKLLHFSLVTSGLNYTFWPLRSTVSRPVYFFNLRPCPVPHKKIFRCPAKSPPFYIHVLNRINASIWRKYYWYSIMIVPVGTGLPFLHQIILQQFFFQKIAQIFLKNVTQKIKPNLSSSRCSPPSSFSNLTRTISYGP